MFIEQPLPFNRVSFLNNRVSIYSRVVPGFLHLQYTPRGYILEAMKEKTQKQLLNRLSRIEGQIRGLKKMVENEEYCIDIITQSHAVRSSLNSFESLMLKNHLETHVMEQMKSGKSKQASEEIMEVYKLSSKK